MKKLFPDRKHISILTQVTALMILMTLFTHRARAVCNVGVCSGNVVTETECSYSDNSSTRKDYCCTGNGTISAPNECAALISRLQNQSNTTSNVGVASNINPNGNCGDTAIDTALGCLSVDTKGFTVSLLTFLAGTAGAISLVIMLIATVQIMTGGDNAEAVKKGKELFTSAVTGLLFIIFSVTLLRIIAGDIIQLPGFN